MIADALKDERHSLETTVRRFQIRSVLVIPAQAKTTVLGAVYLENNQLARAFGESELELAQAVTRLLTEFLWAARLLPHEIDRPRTYLESDLEPRELLGGHPSILKLKRHLHRVADAPTPVLIQGESGTGKELVARSLHSVSSRRQKPFVALNCAAIPESLFESELFGYEKGAFTGAVQQRKGSIELAAGGTLLLDEVGELPLPLQAKLLRFLQDYEVRRVGGRRSFSVEVRIVSATSRDLEALCFEKRFLQALFYRLNVLPLTVPPLRERKQDIPLLLDHFLERHAALYRTRPTSLDPVLYDYFLNYDYPGNVRELESLVHRTLAFAVGKPITVSDLPEVLREAALGRIDIQERPSSEVRTLPELRRQRESAKASFDEAESELIRKTLEACA